MRANFDAIQTANCRVDILISGRMAARCARMGAATAAATSVLVAASLAGRTGKKSGGEVARHRAAKTIRAESTFKRNGVTFHLIKTPGGWRAPTLFWLDTWLIRRKLAEIKPDMVHAWGAEHGAALVATRLKYPFVTTVQGLLMWYAEVTQLNCYH